MKVHISNNIIAALAIALMISSVTLNWTIISTRDIQVTGKAVSTGSVSLCYNHPPQVVHDCPDTLYQGEPYQCDLNVIDLDCRESCLEINTSGGINLTVKNHCRRSVSLTNMSVWWDSSIDLQEIIMNNTLATDPQKDEVIEVGQPFTNMSMKFSDDIDKARIHLNIEGTERIIEIHQNKTRQIQGCNASFNAYSSDPLDSHIEIDNHGFINFTVPLTTDDTYTRNNPYPIQWYVSDESGCSNHLTIKPDQLNISIRNHPPSITTFSPSGNLTLNETDNQTFFIRYRDFERENSDPSDDTDLIISWYDGSTLLSRETDTEYTDRSSTFVWETDYYTAGNHTITANVSDGHYSATHQWQIQVLDRNRPPRFTRPLPNQTWQKNRIRAAFRLDDYTEDPDLDDNLTYSAEYASPFHAIDVTIDEESTQALFSQPRDWMGTEQVRFHVKDRAGENDTSNWITLEVTEGEQTQTEGSEGDSSGGGAGGGGGGMPQTGGGDCEPVWFCGDWSDCNRSNVSTRICYDLAECGTDEEKPYEYRRCTYIPECQNGKLDQGETEIDCGGPCKPCYTCYDRIKNQGEEGVDCGGPCKPCPTCDDGIQNQGEQGIDCGGPCKPCETCNDGIQNQGEQGVDCGGPCPKCSVLEEPAAVISANLKEHVMLIGTVTSLILLALIATVIISHKKTIVKDIPVNQKKQPTIEHVSKTFREHLQETLDTKEQLTYEEMEEKIKHLPPEKQSHVKRLLEQLSELEYADKDIDQEKIDHLHHELELALTTKDKDKLQLQIEHINELIRINHIEEARKEYQQLMALYGQSSQEKKKEYYNDIQEIFRKLR
ncbi:MAG: hypothetical protein R6V53_00595 [Candidatus Woesearchaeota archaeon]